MSCDCWQMTKLKNIQKVNLIFNLIFFICSVGNEEVKWKKKLFMPANEQRWQKINWWKLPSSIHFFFIACHKSTILFVCLLLIFLNLSSHDIDNFFFHRSLSICCFYFLHKKKFPYEILCRTWNSYKKRNLWAYLKKCYQHHAKGWKFSNIF